MLLEFALAFPILPFLTLGTCVLSLGVSQFQQVAALSAEGARWGSVQGAEYQQPTGKPAATGADIFNQAILPLAVGMPAPSLESAATWAPDNRPGSTLSVKVTYQWLPSAYPGAVDISNTSVTIVSY